MSLAIIILYEDTNCFCSKNYNKLETSKSMKWHFILCGGSHIIWVVASFDRGSLCVVIVINNLSLSKECATPFPGRAWLGGSEPT